MVGMRHESLQYGFTLLETVIVIFILAVIAGTVISVFNTDVIEEKEETAVEFEMIQIRDAIRNFIQDNPAFDLSDTSLCTPADASFLILDSYDSTGDCNPDTSYNTWDPQYRLGWRGPYLSTNATQYVDIGDDLQHNGTGSPISGTLEPDILAIADSFIHKPIFIEPDTFFQWRKVSGDASSNMDKNGRPYLLFDLDDKSSARIVSMGPDGIYDSEGTGCEPGGDDYVLCVY